MDLREAMKPYIKALSDAIESGNWHLALMPALTLPDICRHLDGKPQDREYYINWIDTYSVGTNFQPTFYGLRTEYYKEIQNRSIDMIEPYNVKFIDGVIVYALRCAFLHQGDISISDQKVHKKDTLGINKIKFISDGPKINQQIGENVVKLVKIYEQIEDVVELDVKSFCEEILVCIEKWIAAKENSPDVVERANKMVHFIS